MKPKHFLTLTDLSSEELHYLMERAQFMKSNIRLNSHSKLMSGMTMAMLFEKTSTRTRVSFEVAASQFGGHALFLAPGDSQLSRGEPLSDTARVLSRMADLIVMRTSSQERLLTVASNSGVPVINAMSNEFHPCQLLADIFTFIEKRGSIRNANVAWIGDGNNVCHSWIHAASQFDFNLRIASPKGYSPNHEILNASCGRAHIIEDITAAVRGCDVVVTDTWFSIGQENDKTERKKAFSDYSVTAELMSVADPNALFMHCLPAYRGNEVTADVIDGLQSVVWDEAENRLHTQKALIEFLLQDKDK